MEREQLPVSITEKLEHRPVRRIADGFLPEGFVYATSILWQRVPE